MRTAYDFTPLYRSMIGVDHMADLVQSALGRETDGQFPAYDIEKTGDDSYRITLAAAGFSKAELEVQAQPNLLVVTGRKAKPTDDSRAFLHRGIAARNFERRFELADYVVVKDAAYADGVLSISLAREVPEALKPRRIAIGAGESSPIVHRIEGGKAA